MAEQAATARVCILLMRAAEEAVTRQLEKARQVVSWWAGQVLLDSKARCRVLRLARGKQVARLRSSRMPGVVPGGDVCAVRYAKMASRASVVARWIAHRFVSDA